MKVILLSAAILLSGAAHAAEGVIDVQPYPATNSIEIKGAAAQKLYERLQVREYAGGDAEEWAPLAIKEGESLTCMKWTATDFSCRMYMRSATGKISPNY